MLKLIPVSLKTANAFVAEHHRHHKSVTGHKFSLGCMQEGQLVGVAIVGRPVSRYLDDGLTLEVNRLCSTGEKNVCSFLYGAAARAGKALSEDSHIYTGHGAGDQPPGCWLGVYGLGWRQAVDRNAPPCCRSVSSADEAAL